MEQFHSASTSSDTTFVGSAAAAAAGWYPDPRAQHASRYWDGSTWTDHVSGQPAGAGPVAVADSAAQTTASATRTQPAANRAKRRAVMIAIGGGLMAVGALLPWETVTAAGATVQSVKGTSEGAGGIVLVSGGIIALLAFLFLNGTLRRKASIGTLILSLVSLVFAWGNFSAISDDTDQAQNAAGGFLKVEATVGIGILMVLAGCVMAAIASFLLLRQKDELSS